MKTVLLFLAFSLTVADSYAQEGIAYANRASIQFAVCPALVYNSVALGFGVKNERIEHVFEVNGILIPLLGGRLAMGIHYNRNLYLKNDKTFIPFWAGIKKVNMGDHNYEDGGPFYDKLFLRIGSGIGTNLILKKDHHIRLELGVGAAVAFEDKASYRYPVGFFFRPGVSEFKLMEGMPVLPAVRAKIRFDLGWGR